MTNTQVAAVKSQAVTKLYNGNPVEILAVVGGWTTFRDTDQSIKKDRNSQFFEVPANAQAAPAKAGATRSVADARKAEKAPITVDHSASNKLIAAAIAKDPELGRVASAKTVAYDFAEGSMTIAEKVKIVADAAEHDAANAKKEAPAKPAVKATVTPYNRHADKLAAEAAAKGDTAPAAKATKSIVKSDYKAGYQRTDIKTASGSKVIDCGDHVAQLLRGKTLDECYSAVAADMAEWIHPKIASSGQMDRQAEVEVELGRLYGHLNPGQQRMNLGNLIRPWHRLDAAAKLALLEERLAKRGRDKARVVKAATTLSDAIEPVVLEADPVTLLEQGDKLANQEAAKSHRKAKKAGRA